MPKKRMNKADEWMPTRVYRGKSSYEYRPKGAKVIPLCPLVRDELGAIIEPPEVKRAVLEEYNKATKEAKQAKNIDYWLSRFFLDRRYLRLAKTTQKDYKRYAEVTEKPDEPLSRNGVRFVFGKMMPAAVKPYHIRRYMDYWAEAGKEPTANRHLSFLQTFFGWLRQQNTGIILNPADKITKFREESRKVYIDDDKYSRMLEAAAASSTPYVAAVMEVAYLCGLRKHEVLRLNLDDITPAGIVIRRGKGSKGEITEISPRLQRAIDIAKSINHDGPEPLKNRPLFRSMKKSRVSRSALDKAWRKIRAKAGTPDFQIHDLKKKAGTDGKDLGHKTQAMKELYDLQLKVKKATR